MMQSIQRTISVEFRHQVVFSDDVFNPENATLCDVLAENPEEGIKKAFVVLDEGLAEALPELVDRIIDWFAAHRDRLNLVAEPMILEGGERVKNSYFHVSEIQSHLERHKICRHSYLIAIGGGALLDVVGLAAATAHRGVRHVRIPTTTLAQDDSGVGVKNGINAFGKKNFIGSFAPPYAVINDFHFITTLPDRDKRGGYIEAVKVACIRDREFFERMERDAEALAAFEPAAMKHLIFRSAELHVNHIAGSGDPFEFGSARPLDFGHWAAHKLEQISEYRIRHGEAVAIGVALDMIYARDMGFIDAKSAERVISLIEKLGFQIFAKELLSEDSDGNLVVIAGLEEFREHLGGQLTITLLKEIGQGFEIHDIVIPKMVNAIYQLRDRHEARAKKIVKACA